MSQRLVQKQVFLFAVRKRLHSLKGGGGRKSRAQIRVLRLQKQQDGTEEDEWDEPEHRRQNSDRNTGHVAFSPPARRSCLFLRAACELSINFVHRFDVS